jgi:hypothetical protein
MKRVMVFTALFALAMLVANISFATERTEVVSMRTEYAKVFDNGNGTYTAEIKNHPVHKKNIRGEWIDFSKKESFVAKVADEEELYMYDCYTVALNDQNVYPGSMYTPYVGQVYSNFEQPEWRTAYLWYTAGLPPITILSAQYELYLSTTYENLHIGNLSYNPRWSDYSTIWYDCFANVRKTVTYYYAGTRTIEFNSSMISDLEYAISSTRGWFGLGHVKDEPQGLSYIGNSSTLTFTWESRKKIIPNSVVIAQNLSAAPNPFNPYTDIFFDLKMDAHVTLEVFTINGQKIETLVDNHLRSGKHSVRFNGSRYSSGVYICKLRTSGNTLTTKMYFIK